MASSPQGRREASLASVWLLFQPEEKQVGILTVASKADGKDPAEAASRSITALEKMESSGRLLPAELSLEKVFDLRVSS